MGNYMIAAVRVQPTDCRLEGIKNVRSKHELRFGIPRGVGFPDDASFRMTPDFPKAIKLTDVLDNTSMLLVGSSRLVEFLRSNPGALFSNELLPVKIINHKGRIEAAEYWIIHQIDHPACVDEGATVGKRNPIDPERYQLMQNLVLDESKIDERLMLFRARQYPDVVLVRRDLAARLEAEKFNGLSLFELDAYAYFGK